jgi:hypothetical protein
MLFLDYRIKTLSKRVPVEQLYNLIDKDNKHIFLDKIVKIHEIRPNTEFP